MKNTHEARIEKLKSMLEEANQETGRLKSLLDIHKPRVKVKGKVIAIRSINSATL